MAHISTAQRNKLSTSEFALPAQRKYPVDTKNRARNALSRVSEYGDSATKAKVRAKVHAKFPEIGQAQSAYHARRAHYGRLKG